jgi:hypothetical protein
MPFRQLLEKTPRDHAGNSASRSLIVAPCLALADFTGRVVKDLLGYPNGPQLKPDELRRALTALVSESN